METINNIAAAAAEVVWPSTTSDSNTAAASQTQADFGSRSDVYNDGASSTAPPDHTKEPLSGVLGNTKRGEPYDAGNKADQDAALQAAPSSSSFADENAALTSTDTNKNTTGTTEAAGAVGLNSSRTPNTTVDDGSAGRANPDSAGGSGVGVAGADASDKPQTESQGEGTGEKYIRSTGLKADGGDFDAAREGAGREADRLLEQKGVVVTKAPKDPDVATTKPSPSSHAAKTTTIDDDHKEKKSLGDKIKEKLHK